MPQTGKPERLGAMNQMDHVGDDPLAIGDGREQLVLKVHDQECTIPRGQSLGHDASIHSATGDCGLSVCKAVRRHSDPMLRGASPGVKQHNVEQGSFNHGAMDGREADFRSNRQLP